MSLFPKRLSERLLDLPLSQFPSLWQDLDPELKSVLSELTMYEDKNNHIIVEVEIPGFKQNEIKVSVNRGILCVKGEKKEEESSKDKKFLQKSTHYASRSYRIALPDQIDEKEIKASYKDGILKVSFQKAKATETKEIQVQLG
jgi:HSP20 family protein